MKNATLYTKLFVLFFSILLFSVGFMFWYGLKTTSDSYINAAYEMSYKNSNTLEVAIESKLSHVPKDVIFATEFYALRKYLTWRAMGETVKAHKWKKIFSNTMLDILRTKKTYYKARVIDVNGDELINAQYLSSVEKIVLLKEKDLQNKSFRDYVKKTKKLKKGQFYISSMNLNEEHGKIEEPYTPVIRYATPIVDNDEKVLAIYVVSVYADKILDILEEQNSKDKEKGINYYLVDKEGSYLYHKDVSKRWGVQLRNGHNLNNDHFNVKDFLHDDSHGSFSKDGKIYSFHKVYPLEGYTNEFWYIVSSVEEEIALFKLQEFKYMFIIITFIVLLISFFFIRILVKRITQPLHLVSQQLLSLSMGEVKKETIHYAAKDEIGDIVHSTQKVIDSIDKVIRQANAVSNGELETDVELLGKNDKLGLAINKMTQRLREIELLAQNLSIGNYDTMIIAKSSSDKLGLALINMISYLEAVTKVAESVSKGELNISYKAVGTDDRLGLAMLKMVSYLKNILDQADAISKEDFSQTLRAKSNNDELSQAIIVMTNILSKTYIKNKEEMFFSEGVGQFSDAVTGLDSSKELVENSLSILCRYINATSGIVYIYDKEKSTLNLEASFAHTYDEIRQKSFNLGESIIGQVGVDQEHVLLKNVKDDLYTISTGMTHSRPKEVFIFPLVYKDALFGVVEIMSFEKFTKVDRDYLLKAAGIFASLLNSSTQNTQIKSLLERSQRAFEELQVQSEELQESNVQMEEQQQQLTMQSQELKDKNENLAKAKEEIDKRAQDLETASRYKSEFLANMSHELRTPLNSIILLSKLLSKNESLEVKDLEKTTVINKAGNDLLLLINDILDLSKIESGNMELYNEEVYSGDFMDDMQGLFGSIAQEKNIDFLINDNFNTGFLTDRIKLSQVLKNLLSNAFKFTKKGSVHLEVNKVEKNIEFKVSDTGIGIPSTKVETIFEAFKQVDGSISREFGGTGLGLSISKTIVEHMGGKIKVESELDRGTSFSVVIPLIALNGILSSALQKEQEVKYTPATHSLEEEADESSELKGKNILIVDDDSRNIFTLTSVLENLEAEVYNAFNGFEAIEMLEKDEVKIDLILMDIMMPVMDGLEAIKKIKDTPNLKEIPIIAITAKTMKEDKQICLDVGASEYLAKPIDTSALIFLVKAWIK